MKTTETVTAKKQIDLDVICDCCGHSCLKRQDIVDNEAHPDHGLPYRDFEYMNLEAHWGYESNRDGEKWTAQVCEKCTVEILATLINFKKENYF